MHKCTLHIEGPNNAEYTAQLQLALSLMYPYVAPVISVQKASVASGGPSKELSAAGIAAIEAEVNVDAAAKELDDTLPAQLAHLCCALVQRDIQRGTGMA